MGGQQRDAVIFTKLRPFEEWGNYVFKLDIVRPKQIGGSNASEAKVEGPQMNDQGNNAHGGGYDYDDLVEA